MDRRYNIWTRRSSRRADCNRFPKCFSPVTIGDPEIQVQGTYQLANLLQELFHAQECGEKYLELDSRRLSEDPVRRLERLIKGSWWDNLTRTIDAAGIAKAAKDPKTAADPNDQPRIYVPRGAPEQYTFYSRLARERPEMNLDVQWLPEGEITDEFIRSLNDKAGLLALEMKEDPNERLGLKGLPFVVPGDRFNELYNWDAYFIAVELADTHPHLADGILRNFIFEIKHYGKTLNANRSYYLGRAQPPFLTDLALKNYAETRLEPGARDLLKLGILAAMKEYYNYWMMPPRYDETSGLTRYRPIGVGICPETPAHEFIHVLAPYAEKYNMTLEDFGHAYTFGEIQEPDLDTFFRHDRAVRENGHDTCKRLEGLCADLGTVDLNCLLYKIETDIAKAIRTIFDDHLLVPGVFCAPGQVADRIESSAAWDRAARKRKQLIDNYMWNEEKGMYFDYNTETKTQTNFEYATTFWPLWCGVASPHQAALIVKKALPKFECVGGLSTSTEHSRGPVTAKNPQRQWDYPYGWAPHQIMAWDGLKKYGYHEEAERLCYRWLHMLTRVFVDYNGMVVEKYDVTTLDGSHKVAAEYGNQGTHFKYANQEG